MYNLSESDAFYKVQRSGSAVRSADLPGGSLGSDDAVRVLGGRVAVVVVVVL